MTIRKRILIWFGLAALFAFVIWLNIITIHWLKSP